MKKLFVLILLSICFVSTTHAVGSSFKDVKSDHWAYAVIQWAIENKIVTGYPDNTFRPENDVTEAEFLSMFIRTYETLDKAKMNEHWSEPVYLFAASKQWPLNGDEPSLTSRNKPITRLAVAEIIAAADGQNVRGDKAIEYLLEKEYSHGKSAATVEGYKGDDTLKRAEAVRFIWNLQEKGLSELLKAGVKSIEEESPKGLTYSDDIDDSLKNELELSLVQLLFEAASKGEEGQRVPYFTTVAVVASKNDNDIRKAIDDIHQSAKLQGISKNIIDESYIPYVKEVFDTEVRYYENQPHMEIAIEYTETKDSPLAKVYSNRDVVVVYVTLYYSVTTRKE